MAAMLKGSKAFAVVLCRFKDIPELNIPKSRFFQFVAESGRGALNDYWKDISYRNIDLDGSDVFGWFTMKYSFAADGADPYHDGKFHHNRVAWIDEAIRLCGENRIDLSRFYGLLVVVNAPVDDSNAGLNTVMAIGDEWGQAGWRWCNKCQGLVFSQNSPGFCPSGGVHDNDGSGQYALSANDPSFPGQTAWARCTKCETVNYTGNSALGPCAAGGKHTPDSSATYRIGFGKVGYTGQHGWQFCNKCFVLAYSAVKGNLGACPAGGSHDHTNSSDYTVVGLGSNFDDTFNAHETGHCFGLGHSWSENPDVQYGDPWDVMSAMQVKDYDNESGYAPAGPGLNAPTLYRLGWLSEERVVHYNASETGTELNVDLLALNHPEKSGTFMALIQTGGHLYSVEFRRPSAWDTGIGQDAVLIHELRSTYLIDQRHWKWCNKCQALTWTGWAPCPSGSVHDHSTSSNYNLVLGDPSDPGQRDWKHCTKCQSLVFSADTSRTDGPGPCSAGGQHNYGTSGNYSIPLGDPGFNGQAGWRWCRKCEGLTYTGSSLPGDCAGGGVHDHSGSGSYTISISDSTPGGQGGWRWCRKCQVLAFDGYNYCTAGGNHNQGGSGDYGLRGNDPHFPGQPHWKFCNKCYGLAYSGGALGRCAGGGTHDPTNSADYSLLQNVGDANGQKNWLHCNKCHLLSYSTDPNNMEPCPAGGKHDSSGSSNYTLSNFGQDTTYLVQSSWQPGQLFLDTGSNVAISIGSINDAADTVRVSIGPVHAAASRNAEARPLIDRAAAVNGHSAGISVMDIHKATRSQCVHYLLPAHGDTPTKPAPRMSEVKGKTEECS